MVNVIPNTRTKRHCNALADSFRAHTLLAQLVAHFLYYTHHMCLKYHVLYLKPLSVFMLHILLELNNTIIRVNNTIITIYDMKCI